MERRKKRENFCLIRQPGTQWFDIKYDDEEKPRYYLDGKTGQCTCKGATHGCLCKHAIKWYEMVYMISGKFETF